MKMKTPTTNQIEVSGHMTEQAYVDARYQNARESRRLIGLAILLPTCLLIWAFLSAITSLSTSIFGDTSGNVTLFVLLFFILFPFLLANLVRYTFFSRWDRRIYRQEPDLHLPFVLTVNKAGLLFENDVSVRLYEWSDIRKGEIGKSSIVIYLDGRKRLFIPKSIFSERGLADFNRFYKATIR